MIIRILIEFNFNMAHISTGLISSLMVFILIMQGNVSRSIPEGAISTTTDFECQIDNDCFEKNTYCDVSLNLCSQCLNCSIYFRTPKKHIECPKYLSDCSNCLDGYWEEIFFGGEIRDTCIPIHTNNILPTAEKISSNFYWQNIGIVFIIVNMVLLSLLWTYHYKRVFGIYLNSISNTSQVYTENLPPSYNSCMKLDNYVTDDTQEFHLFTGEQPPRNEWRHQNAVPFRLDSPEDNNAMDENENTEDVNDTAMRDVENLELHDEETMPSEWTPPLPPSPPVVEPRVLNFQSNFQISSPPSKRRRLVLQSSDEKTDYEDDDNASDMSQDEL